MGTLPRTWVAVAGARFLSRTQTCRIPFLIANPRDGNPAGGCARMDSQQRLWRRARIRSSGFRLKDDRRSVTKDFRGLGLPPDVGGVVTKSHDGVGA